MAQDATPQMPPNPQPLIAALIDQRNKAMNDMADAMVTVAVLRERNATLERDLAAAQARIKPETEPA